MLGISGATWGTIIISVLGIIGFVVRARAQSRASKELVEASAQKDLQLAELKRESEERAAKFAREASERDARHAKEAEERAEAAKERAADRASIENLIALAQAQTDRTLAIMERELKVTQEMNARNFELLDRNTRAAEKMTETMGAIVAEMRTHSADLSSIKGGAACRAGFGKAA